MNTTEAILAALPATVAELTTTTGKSESTIRKALKDLEASGKVSKDGTTWSAVKAASKRDKATKAEPKPKAEVDPKTGKKKYRKNPKPVRETRKNRLTKAVLTVRNAEELSSGFDETAPGDLAGNLEDMGWSGEKWVTTCVTHEHAIGSDYILDAWHHNSLPAFCPDCRKLMKPQDIKAAKELPSVKRAEKKVAAK